MAQRSLYALAVLGFFVIAGTLASWGQPLICTCGDVKLWIGSIFDSGNSQHIADWYTLSHILHGVLIALLGRVLFPRIPYHQLFLFALATGVAWEIIEHTEFVLGAFRATTINQGYFGDSVLNAVSDYLFMIAGFLIAMRLRIWQIVVMIVVFELAAALIARDSLTLATIMLLFPIDALEHWQQAINPLNVAS